MADVEVRIRVSFWRHDYVEIRQEELCCNHCNWVPSDSRRGVQVRRKMLHTPDKLLKTASLN